MKEIVCDLCRKPKPGDGDLDGVMQRIGFIAPFTDRDPMICNDCLPFDQPTEWEREDEAKRFHANRKAEKEASRRDDVLALATGQKTPAMLKEENSHFARLNLKYVRGRRLV